MRYPDSTEAFPMSSDYLASRSSIDLMGLDVDPLTEPQTVEAVLEALRRGRGGWLCPVNLDVLRQVVEDPAIADLVGSADLVVADGMPLVWASKIKRTPLPARVAGSSLISSLTEAAAGEGRSIYLLGGNEGAAEAAKDKLIERSPALSVTGWHCPPFGFEHDDEEMTTIERSLVQASPDIVFVGLGFPKQDRLIVRLRALLPDAWFVSCGISFSFLTGEVRRAPAAMQALGLEWVHRMAQEPDRLVKRYLVDDMPFAVRLAISSAMAR